MSTAETANPVSVGSAQGDTRSTNPLLNLLFLLGQAGLIFVGLCLCIMSTTIGTYDVGPPTNPHQSCRSCTPACVHPCNV